jgi:hypothetical protein
LLAANGLARVLPDRRPLPPEFPVKSVFNNKPARARATVSGPVRSVQRSGRRGVGELLDGNGDPAPGVGAVVIAIGRELVGARDALFERFLAIALQHQGGGTPDIDLGYHAAQIAGLRSTNV